LTRDWDNTGGAGFVDQNTVGLVDQRHPQPAKQQARITRARRIDLAPALMKVARRGATHQPVTQIVDHELLGGAVGDIAAVAQSALRHVHRARHGSYAQAQRTVNRCQQLRVARDQIVVRGNQMHRHAGERGSRGSQRSIRSAFTRGHLRELVAEHDLPGDQLVSCGEPSWRRVASHQAKASRRFVGERRGASRARIFQARLESVLGQCTQRLALGVDARHERGVAALLDPCRSAHERP
jgi:hypothetical protein